MHISQKPIMKVNHFLLAFLYSNEVFLTFVFLTNLNFWPLDWPIRNTRQIIRCYIWIPFSIPHVHRNYLIPIIQKNHFDTLIFASPCVQTQPIMTLQNQLNMQTVTLPLQFWWIPIWRKLITKWSYFPSIFKTFDTTYYIFHKSILKRQFPYHNAWQLIFQTTD